MKNANLLLFFMLFLGGCHTTLRLQHDIPDQIIIYYLSQFRSSLVDLSCESIQHMPDVKTKLITDRTEISKAYELFVNNSNLVLDTAYKHFDARYSIVFKYKGTTTNTTCIAKGYRVVRNGAVYKYNSEVEDFLLSNKLIIKFIR